MNEGKNDIERAMDETAAGGDPGSYHITSNPQRMRAIGELANAFMQVAVEKHQFSPAEVQLAVATVKEYAYNWISNQN